MRSQRRAVTLCQATGTSLRRPQRRHSRGGGSMGRMWGAAAPTRLLLLLLVLAGLCARDAWAMPRRALAAGGRQRRGQRQGRIRASRRRGWGLKPGLSPPGAPVSQATRRAAPGPAFPYVRPPGPRGALRVAFSLRPESCRGPAGRSLSPAAASGVSPRAWVPHHAPAPPSLQGTGEEGGHSTQWERFCSVPVGDGYATSEHGPVLVPQGDPTSKSLGGVSIYRFVCCPREMDLQPSLASDMQESREGRGQAR